MEEVGRKRVVRAHKWVRSDSSFNYSDLSSFLTLISSILCMGRTESSVIVFPVSVFTWIRIGPSVFVLHVRKRRPGTPRKLLKWSERRELSSKTVVLVLR